MDINLGSSTKTEDEEINAILQSEEGVQSGENLNAVPETQLFDDVGSGTRISSNPSLTGDGLLVRQIEELTTNRNDLEKEVTELKEKNKSYKDTLEIANKTIGDNNYLVNDLQSKLDMRLEELTLAKKKFSELSDMYVKLSEIAKGNKALYDETYANLMTLQKEVKVSEETRLLLETKDSLIEKTQLDLKNAEDSLNSLQVEMNEVERKYSELKEKYGDITEEFDQLRIYNTHLDEQVSEQKQRINELNKQLQDALKLDKTELVIELQNELECVRMKLADKLTKEQSSLTANLMSAEKLRAIEEKIEENNLRYRSLESSFIKREKELEESKRKLEENLNNLELQCEEQVKENSELHLSIKTLEEQSELLKEQLSNSQSEYDNLEKQHLSTKEELNDLEKEREELVSNQSRTEDEKHTLVEELIKHPLFYDAMVDGKLDISKLSNVLGSLPREDMTQTSDTSLTEEVNKELEDLRKQLKQEEEMNADLEKKNEELTLKLGALEKTQQVTGESQSNTAVQTAKLLELENKLSEAESSLERSRKNALQKDESINNLKQDNTNKLNEISRLEKELKLLATSKTDASVEEYLMKHYGKKPAELFNRYNELLVTIEIAEYNVSIIKQFPKAKEILDKKLRDNKAKLASILNRPYQP